MTMTAEKIAAALEDAAAAVRHYHGVDERDIAETVLVGRGRIPKPSERKVRSALWIALQAGHTAAAVAARAGVRQLLVAQLIEDADARRQALVAARHDAERYATQVREAVREAVLAELADGAAEQPTAARWGLAKETVRKWQGKSVVGWN